MFKKVWVVLRKPLLLLAIPSLWILYGLLLQVFPSILRHTQSWYISRLVMLIVAVVFVVFSFVLVSEATS